MSAKYDVDMDVEALETSDPFDYYTKVIIVAGETEDGENIMGTAGDDSGKTLEVHIPLFSAPAGQSESVFALADALAADILNQLKEYEYQPFDARGVIAPLEATLGDGIVINDVYGAINKQQIEFHPLTTFDYSSDGADDDDNEFGITKKSETERLLEGFVRYASTIEMHANSILAEVRSNKGDLSRIEQRIDDNESSISLLVTKTADGGKSVNASVIISAITTEDEETGEKKLLSSISLDADVIKASGVMTWGNIDNKPNFDEYVTSGGVTTIVEDSIATANVYAKNIKVGELIGQHVYLKNVKETEVTEYDEQGREKTYTKYDYIDAGEIEIITPNYGSTVPSGEEDQFGISIKSDYATRLVSDKGNVFIQSGSGAFITVSNSDIINLAGKLVVKKTNYGTNEPGDVFGNGETGQVYFQIVS